jgi:hypothetical protein
MKFVAKVHEPMYDFNSKKYIRFIIPAKVSEIIERMHTLKQCLIKNQTCGQPPRWSRPHCEGSVPL